MTDADAHRAAVESWRAQRYAALRRETGWLTLAGLGWLKKGENTIGSDPSCDVVLPAGPPRAGTIAVRGGSVTAAGEFAIAGADGVADGTPLLTDREGEPTLLLLGGLRLCVIERGGRLGVRTWNTDAPLRRDFAGIDHWPVDLEWRRPARFEPTPGRELPVPDVLGIDETQESPGDVVLEWDGAEHRLQALEGGDSGELWLVFGDATNGTETYGGGRFVYTSRPERTGRLTVDFNRAYNPPCVFSPFATCPLPWPANRLPFRVEAGERRYEPPGAEPPGR